MPGVRRRSGPQGRAHGLGDELALLTVHGMLHLLGYDHGEPEQEREMFGLQTRCSRSGSRPGTRPPRGRLSAATPRLLGTVGLEDS